MQQLLIDPSDKRPKVTQIEQAIIRDIEKGILKKDERLPSISEFSKRYKIAKDTVEKAYNRLKEDGYLVAVKGKGNFVAEGNNKTIRILMILNKLSAYKKTIYDAFVEKLGSAAKVDLQVHHYDPKILKDILDSNRGKYHYYVVMPHFFHEVKKDEFLEVVKTIPSHELVVLDKKLDVDDEFMSVYQDFKMDIYNALSSSIQLFENYQSITVLFPVLSHHPQEITDGVKLFCKEQRLKFNLIYDVQKVKLKAGQVYICLVESELADLIKKIRTSDLEMGKDIGVISFNETVLNELLDITSISTDFKEMGTTAASLILKKEFKKIHNPYKFIHRASL